MKTKIKNKNQESRNERPGGFSYSIASGKATKQSQKNRQNILDKKLVKPFRPGILLAVIFAGIYYFKNFLPQPKPIIIKNKIANSNYSKTTITPELNFLLDNKKKFNLNKKQIAKIKKLYKEYLREAKPLKTQLKNEALNFTNYIQQKENKNMQITEMQKQTQLTGEFSKEFYELRKFYWKKAETILNKQQTQNIKNTLSKLSFKNLQKYVF